MDVVTPPVELSVVTTLYRSAPHVEAFCRRAAAQAARLTPDFEIVLVNDGSPDESLAIARRLLAQEPRLRVVDLARNYGQYRAMMAALAESRGRRVFLADCDLEEPPELLERFWAELEADPELDLVYGYQKRRRGSWLDRVLGRGYYTVLDLVSPVRVPANTVTARLATRVYVDALLAHGEEPISFDALSALAGCRQKGVEVVKARSSPTTYGFCQRVSLALRALLAVGDIPFRVIGALGVVAIVFAGVVAVAALAGVLAATATLWLIASTWLLGGAILVALAVLGLSIGLVLDEARRRPTVVRRRYGPD